MQLPLREWRTDLVRIQELVAQAAKLITDNQINGRTASDFEIAVAHIQAAAMNLRDDVVYALNPDAFRA
jgi:hypothetical protein